MTRQGLLASSHPAAHDIIDKLAFAVPSRLTHERTDCIEVRTARGIVGLLVEPVLPAPHLFIFGAGSDAVPLAVTARHLGWLVTVWGASESFEGRSRLVVAGAAVESSLEVVRSSLDANRRSMAVVMGHNLSRDREALKTALASRALYIGVLGPRHRTASLAAELSGAVLSDPRVHAPVGLDIGAETPEEIALSITSELLACMRGASTLALRHRGRIHDDTA
jgi:xanthine dehydrogenase accessory factor